jgi:two-component system response regulator GlrR
VKKTGARVPTKRRQSAGRERELDVVGYRELRKRVLSNFESDYVWNVLIAAQGNISRAARLAQIDRKHFWRLIQRNGIKVKVEKSDN